MITLSFQEKRDIELTKIKIAISYPEYDYMLNDAISNIMKLCHDFMKANPKDWHLYVNNINLNTHLSRL